LRAKQQCLQELASGDQARVDAAQIQLALLSPAFLMHCQDMMNFSRDFAEKQLKAHMFQQEYAANQKEWEGHIQKILENLTSTSKHLLHGRMITLADMRADADLQRLKVVGLESDAPYWLALNELLLRTEIVAQLNELGKLVFTSDFHLVSS
jgi:hypothetical protein